MLPRWDMRGEGLDAQRKRDDAVDAIPHRERGQVGTVHHWLADIHMSRLRQRSDAKGAVEHQETSVDDSERHGQRNPLGRIFL